MFIEDHPQIKLLYDKFHELRSFMLSLPRDKYYAPEYKYKRREMWDTHYEIAKLAQSLRERGWKHKDSP